MSIEAEFIVDVGAYEHVKITVSGESFGDVADHMDHLTKGEVGENFGDWHASLKAAVLYGRDRALEGLPPNPNEPTPPVGGTGANDPGAAQEGAVEALKDGLGATVLEVEEKPSEGPSSPSVGNWLEVGGTTFVKKSEDPLPESTKPKRPWDKKTPAAKPESQSKSDWDF